MGLTAGVDRGPSPSLSSCQDVPTAHRASKGLGAGQIAAEVWDTGRWGGAGNRGSSYREPCPEGGALATMVGLLLTPKVVGDTSSCRPDSGPLGKKRDFQQPGWVRLVACSITLLPGRETLHLGIPPCGCTTRGAAGPYALPPTALSHPLLS